MLRFQTLVGANPWHPKKVEITIHVFLDVIIKSNHATTNHLYGLIEQSVNIKILPNISMLGWAEIEFSMQLEDFYSFEVSSRILSSGSGKVLQKAVYFHGQSFKPNGRRAGIMDNVKIAVKRSSIQFLTNISEDKGHWSPLWTLNFGKAQHNSFEGSHPHMFIALQPSSLLHFSWFA